MLTGLCKVPTAARKAWLFLGHVNNTAPISNDIVYYEKECSDDASDVPRDLKKGIQIFTKKRHTIDITQLNRV